MNRERSERKKIEKIERSGHKKCPRPLGLGLGLGSWIR